jgi:aminoglycoside phosphotransferase (APT) family kinase protein
VLLSSPRLLILAFDFDDQNFYSYTTGRFLFNEDEQLQERHKRFSAHALKDIAVKALSATSCENMIKLAEGSYNKIFLLTMNTGTQTIARIPHPHAGPAHYTTASEVATMHYIRNKLHIPVPKVLAFSSDSRNPVGSEYIIMEKIGGRSLSSLWDKLSTDARENMVSSLADIEARLFKSRFSHYGCLYFVGDVPRNMCAPHLYDMEHEDDATYCIGPTTETEFWEPLRASLGANPGPCEISNASLLIYLGSSAHDYWRDICQREINWIGKHAISKSEDDPLRQVDSQEDPHCHIALLNRCIDVAPLLTPPYPWTVGTIWHHDLSFQNIMVSDGDKPSIVSLLDWQNTFVGPLYLQFRQPRFLDSENDDDREAIEMDRLRKFYFNCIAKECPYGAKGLTVPYAQVQKILMIESGRSWRMRNKILSLRQGLLNLWRNWNEYALPNPSPLSFSKEEQIAHYNEASGFNAHNDFIRDIRRSIGMSQTGEVNAEDYSERKLIYQDIKQRWIEDMRKEWETEQGTDSSIDWEKYWPFRYPDLGF